MADEKRIISGDFEYAGNMKALRYIGATGPGSVATIKRYVEVDGAPLMTRGYDSALAGVNVEKIVTDAWCNEFENMPALKEIEILHNDPDKVKCTDCPQLSRIHFAGNAKYVPEICGPHGHVRIEYDNGLDLDQEVAGDNIHAVFCDTVENVGIIRGGHVTLGKGVKEISAIKKAEFGIAADTTVAEYELPTRIDFMSEIPPIVGTVAPGAMTVAELHVPAGAIDSYMAHPQWGKAAYFVDADGKTVDKYAAKHKARMKKLLKDHTEAEAKAAEKAKAEKVRAMGAMVHATLATQRLAKWNPQQKYSCTWTVQVGALGIHVEVPEEAPIETWDKIIARLEEVESAQK